MIMRRIIFVMILFVMIIFVGSMILFNDRREPVEQSQGPLLSDEVESYRDLVHQTAEEFGIGNYTDILLAIMMQESGGRETDLMQAAESDFNTRYPNTPGAIEDPEYSIRCGVQVLKYALQRVGVKGPNDLSRLGIAVQAYNLGIYGYLDYMEEIGAREWTTETAQAFAEIASNHTLRDEDNPYYTSAGPWNYGDQHYWEHVKRYYPFG